MDLEREKLERVDRKLLARLGQDETYQMVRVPVTPATWSTWKRYCEARGTSMGRAIMALIEWELGMFADDDADRRPRCTGDAQEQLAGREAELNAREDELDVRERELGAELDQIIAEVERLDTWQAELRSLEQDLQIKSRIAVQPAPAVPKVGRNERCPCGSGRKYKQCHGR